MRRLTSNPLLQALFWLALFILVASTMEGCTSLSQRNQDTLLKTSITVSNLWSRLFESAKAERVGLPVGVDYFQLLQDEIAAGKSVSEKEEYLVKTDLWITTLETLALEGGQPSERLNQKIMEFVLKLKTWGIQEVLK